MTPHIVHLWISGLKKGLCDGLGVASACQVRVNLEHCLGIVQRNVRWDLGQPGQPGATTWWVALSYLCVVVLCVGRVIACVGGVMCMGRGDTRMVSKTTFLPHQIAGEGRDRVMVSKRGFGFWTKFTCVGGCTWGSCCIPGRSVSTPCLLTGPTRQRVTFLCTKSKFMSRRYHVFIHLQLQNCFSGPKQKLPLPPTQTRTGSKIANCYISQYIWVFS